MSVLTMVLIGIVVLCIVAIGAVGDRIRELEDKIESVSSCFKKKASKSLVEGRFKRLESLAKNTDQRLADTIRKLDEFQTKTEARLWSLGLNQKEKLSPYTLPPSPKSPVEEVEFPMPGQPVTDLYRNSCGRYSYTISSADSADGLYYSDDDELS